MSQIFRAGQMPPVFISLMLMRSAAPDWMMWMASAGEKTDSSARMGVCTRWVI